MAEQATCNCTDGPWAFIPAGPGHEEACWVRQEKPYNMGPQVHVYVPDGYPLYCDACGTRLNADGTVTPMVPAVTNEAVRETFFFGNLSDWSRQWGVMLNGTESTPEMKEMPVNISLHVGDVPIILSALQQSGAGDRAARWLAKKYGDLLRCVPHPYGWACDNCFVAGICGKKYRETGVATTGDECDGVVLAAAYATAGEPPPGPDAEDFIDHRFSQPIPIIQELADDLRATPTGVPFRAAGEPPPGPGEEELLDALEGYLAVVGGRIVQIADLPFVVTAADSIAKIARALLAGQTTAPEADSGATRNEEE